MQILTYEATRKIPNPSQQIQLSTTPFPIPNVEHKYPINSYLSQIFSGKRGKKEWKSTN